MSILKNNQMLSKNQKLQNIVYKNFHSIKEFVNTANSRLDAIISITNNSHAIAADAVTAMICETQDSLNAKIAIDSTNKMSVCLRDGEIILRFVSYMLITDDDSVLEKSCLRDLKNTYIALGVPLQNAIRVVELIRDATVSDLRSTVNSSIEDTSFLPDLIAKTESQFGRIINLLK